MYSTGLALEALAGVISLASSEIDQSRVMFWILNWLVVLRILNLKGCLVENYIRGQQIHMSLIICIISMVCKIIVKIFSLDYF